MYSWNRKFEPSKESHLIEVEDNNHLDIFYEYELENHSKDEKTMDIMDRDIEKSKANANPGRFRFNSLQMRGNWDHFVCTTHSASKQNTALDPEKEKTLLSQIKTQEALRSQIFGVNEKSIQSVVRLPKMDAGTPYPPDLSGQEEYTVWFGDVDDLIYPQNWSMNHRSVSEKHR